MTFQYQAHLVDTDLPNKCYAQTALVDLDLDGRLELVVDQQFVVFLECITGS